MKKFWKGIIAVVICYIVGIIAGCVIEGTDTLAQQFTGMYALLGLFGSLTVWLLVYASSNKSGEAHSSGVGTTRSGQKLAQYYDAEWISEKDLKTNSKYMPNTWATLPTLKKSGIIIRNQVKNRQLQINMYKPIHTLVIGTTGSGKTTMIIDPAIRILSHTGEKPCLVVTDPKGELYQNHSKQLRKEGYRIMSLDLRNPFASTRWNPMGNAYDLYHRALNIDNEVKVHNGPVDPRLKKVSPSFEKVWYEYDKKAYGDKQQLVNDIRAIKQQYIDTAENELREIAMNICPIVNKNDQSWEKGAQDLLYGLMLAMLEDSSNPELGMTREKFNFYNLGKIATTRDDDPDNPYGTLREYCGGRGKFSKVPSLTSTAINNAPGTTKSYMGILYSAVAIFEDGGIRFATSQSDMKFDDFCDKPTVLFIKVPDEKESRHCIATMCISQLYKKLIDIASTRADIQLPRTVYFLLDEFANLPKIEKMDSIITVARSRKIFFELVIQSYSQLENKYGKEIAETIKGNCNIQIYLGTEDPKTKEEYSKMCGEVSIELKNTSTSKTDKKDSSTSTTTSAQTVSRPLIGPYELGQLPYGTAIVKIFQNNPIKTQMTQYFQVPEFDQSKVQDEYVASKPFNESEVFYDIRERNKKIYKKSDSSSGFSGFDF